MSPNRRSDDAVAGMGRRTSPCVTSVLNLGNTPRVPHVHTAVDSNMEDADAKALPSQRDERQSRPTQRKIMSLLAMAVVPEERAAFRKRFRNASKDVDGAGCISFCHTPIPVIASAFGCEPFQLRSAADMFPESRIESEFLNEFYIMDVVLNRAPAPAATGDDNKRGEKDVGKSIDVDYDVVRHVVSYRAEDLGPDMDYLYRAAILFLPQCGVFYCHRERRRRDVGVPGTLTAHDMSWLRLRREVTGGDREVSYAFGSDSFVKRFFTDLTGPRVHYADGRPGSRCLDENRRVSAWRISTGRTHRSQQNRVMYRAIQCHDVDGPMLPPDFLVGDDKRTVPPDYRAAAYQRLLLHANSAKKDGRHYVDGCHHYELPESCWIVDPATTHFVDIIVGIDTTNVVGGTRDRESVVMIRNLTKIDVNADHCELLGSLTGQCSEFRKSEAKGTARARSADVGTMFAIGTRIPYERKDPGTGVMSTAPYSANGYVGEGILRDLVVNMAVLGSRCFPQVYSVIRDTEGNSGLQPVPPMDGEALPTPSDPVDEEEVSGMAGHTDDASELATALRGGYEVGDDDDEDDKLAIARRERSLAKEERRLRVGYTIDMSVNLGNSSHFDVHDASQGFSVWTEDVPGCGANWFFVLPNVHGLKPDGVSKFRGLAVKLGHGVAISWDGRVIRHCTSVSHPDGMECGRVGVVKDSHFRNHLYGTFTAAKERIVRVGRAQSAASDSVSPSVVDALRCSLRKGEPRKPPKRRKKRRKSRKKGRQEVAGDAVVSIVVVPVDGGCNLVPQEPVDESSVVREESQQCDDRTSGANMRKEANGGNERKQVTSVNAKRLTSIVGAWRVERGDLDVGGRYKIPRKRKWDMGLDIRSL
jgi:hypothetical protein